MKRRNRNVFDIQNTAQAQSNIRIIKTQTPCDFPTFLTRVPDSCVSLRNFPHSRNEAENDAKERRKQLTRILLVDDDAELGAMLAEYLDGEGFDVSQAYNGKEGLARETLGAAYSRPNLT